MKKRTVRLIHLASYLGLICLVCGLAGPATAQEELRSRLFRDVVAGGGLHFQHWSGADNLEVRQFSVPLTFVWSLNKRLSLDMVAGSGFATLDQDASTSLKGLTDTRIRASCILGDELLLLTAGVSAPTGKTELDDQEREVSNFLAQDGLGFRTPSFGQGLDVNLGAATAHRIGETVFGVGAGYLIKGAFTPQHGGAEYQPGNELSLTAGVDREIMAGDGQLTLDLIYTLYDQDEQEGTKAFQAGDKILLQALGMFRAGLDWRVYLSGRTRGRSTSYTVDSEVEFANGEQFEAGLSAATIGAGPVQVRALGDFKLYADNEFNRGEAAIWGAGPGLRLKMSSASSIDLNFKYLRGSIDAADVSGVDISGGIWIKL